ncbi:MAG: hypothetical protein KGD57_09105 [Candidatus Lokiarchaeota archaeon]|nr:hypothetical protein [Candidatus Lokiarchaeota archaeon]
MIKISLLCEECGKKIGIPKCCNKSMLVKDEYLLCCCSKECGYQAIPKCCNQTMHLIG